MTIAEIFETLMIVAFGISWPVSIIKSVKSKTAKGKSLFFMIMILLGYICGMISKIISHTTNLAFVFYIINAVMVSTDIVLYFINKRRDKLAEKKE